MNLYGSSKVKDNLIRLVVVLLLVIVVTSVSDDHIPTSKKATLLQKTFAPKKIVMHAAKESSDSEKESSNKKKESSNTKDKEASGSSKEGSSEKQDKGTEKEVSSGSDKKAASGSEKEGKGTEKEATSGSDKEAPSGSEKEGKGTEKEAASSSEKKGKGTEKEAASGSEKKGKGTEKEAASGSDKEASSVEGPSISKVASPEASAAEGPSNSKAESAEASSAEGPSSSSKEVPSSSPSSSSKVGPLPSGPITLPSGAVVVDVTEHGAKGNGQPNMEGEGECKNAVAFIQAWHKACENTGPAKVLIPAGDFVVGQVLFAGPCKSSQIMVENKGTLLANPDLSLYPAPEWIVFQHVENVIFTGSGVVNGQGSKNWDKNDCKSKGKGSCASLPTSIKLHRANNSIIDGVKSVDSMFFHMFLAVCQNVTIRGINFTAPETSPNTDGIHTSLSKDVTIYDSIIGTGDDCISIGQGSVNITVFNVKCGPGHGISVGSLGKEAEEQDVRGIHISNCTLKGTDNGARIKTWPGNVDTVADEITYDDIIMDSVKNPIIIDTNYQSKDAKEASHVKISNIRFKNIRGTSSNDAVVTLNCSSAVPCSEVTLDTISLKGPGKAITSCLNAKVQMMGQNEGISCEK
ncbi:hypothetical protein V2J09_009286 [Rumex salicifolius]